MDGEFDERAEIDCTIDGALYIGMMHLARRLAWVGRALEVDTSLRFTRMSTIDGLVLWNYLWGFLI